MKIVVNDCFGGFGLSIAQAEALGLEVTKNEWGAYSVRGETDISIRTDPRLIEMVEAGDPKDGYSSLRVVEIPDGVDWKLDDYDGVETVIWSVSPIYRA